MATALALILAICGVSWFLLLPRLDSVFFTYPTARVWLDQDADGSWDLIEPPLEGICIELKDMRLMRNHFDCAQAGRIYTDSLGNWPGGEHEPIGVFAVPSCGVIELSVAVPEGYRVTTAREVHGCSAEFGLAPSD